MNHLRDVAFEHVYLFRSRKQQQTEKRVENNFAPLRFEKVCRELQESKNCLKYQPKHKNCLNKLQSKENVNFPRHCKCLVYEFRRKKTGSLLFQYWVAQWFIQNYESHKDPSVKEGNKIGDLLKLSLLKKLKYM